MNIKVAAAVAALAFLLTGCGAGDGNTPDPSPTASAPSEATLSEWVKAVGVTEQLTAFSASMGALGTDLQAVDSQDLKAVADILSKQGPTILGVALALASEPASDDAEYEALRTTAALTIRAFGKLAVGLASATDADRLQAVTEATAAMTPMNSAIKAFGDYIAAHGTETVHPAA
jgi:hypothetical protein